MAISKRLIAFMMVAVIAGIFLQTCDCYLRQGRNLIYEKEDELPLRKAYKKTWRDWDGYDVLERRGWIIFFTLFLTKYGSFKKYSVVVIR